MRIWRSRVKESGGKNGYGTYSWSAKAASTLKTYTISDDTYTGFGNQITAKVLSLSKSNKGTEDRFYVMALADASQKTYKWYTNANGKLQDLVSASENDFGTGRDKTIDMIAKGNAGTPYGELDPNDLWGVLQHLGTGYTLVTDGGRWFVPSKAEWSAFGGYFGLTSSNYSDYGLFTYYWTSAQAFTTGAYAVRFEERPDVLEQRGQLLQGAPKLHVLKV